mgnify:CR=1 FL=1
MGKRRMAREMALQMLFQHDLGASEVADVLRTFDPEDYIRQLRADELDSREDEPEAPRSPSRPAPRASPSMKATPSTCASRTRSR